MCSRGFVIPESLIADMLSAAGHRPANIILWIRKSTGTSIQLLSFPFTLTLKFFRPLAKKIEDVFREERASFKRAKQESLASLGKHAFRAFGDL